MKRVAIIAAAVVVLGAAPARAASDAERGKTLFNDPAFAGGKRSCGSCHPHGKGVEKAAGRKDFGPMGKTIEEAVNYCIVNASGGKAIDPASAQMKALVAYLASLKAPGKAGAR